MRRTILITIWSLFYCSAIAQPEPCTEDAMTSTCLGACVVCDIDGFTGTNNLTAQGQTFTGFCTTIFHNMSYIAFIAGSENLTINVAVSNCDIGRGIEVGIFESLDCQTFTPVTDCNTDVPANGNATFSNIVPLVIGQHYYLIMDGSMGDICDWTFNVISGTTAVGDLTTSGVIEGPKELCPELSTTYFITAEVGATFFDWTVNGVTQNSNNPEIDITFPSDGIYELCVTASNVCDEAPVSCTTISVVSPESSYLEETLCADDCIEVAGEFVCESGQYEFVVTLPDGCDSLIFLDLIVLPEIASSIEINLCTGDSFSIGNTAYDATGVFVETIPNIMGCDSTVTLNLTMIDCELIGMINNNTPICHGDENGSIVISIQNGIAPFFYEWNNISDLNISGSGNINTLTDILIENIPAGIYEINIIDSFGDDIVFIEEVIDPPVLTASINAIDYNGYNLTCYNADDGQATVDVSGGIPPYSFLWNNNETQASINNLAAGSYELNIADANGCEILTNINLIQPEPLAFIANYIDPNCDGLETGIVELDSIQGGTPPYAFALDQSEYSSTAIFQNLEAGDYNFSALDANGCFADTSASLYALDIPILFMDEDQEIDLGCNIIIGSETNNTSLIDISWNNIENSLECDDCLETLATPVNDTEYVLTVTSVDDCTASESIFVTVNKIRNVYVPNVFSPDGDGNNDYFFINTNKSVANIKTFRVYDRWGSLMYEERDLPPNEPSSGWDGRFKGTIVNSAVFVWMAEVEYLDGVISTITGDVTVLK